MLLTQLEKECLKYFLELMKTSDMVMITNELSPCKMATTVKAICKTLLNSSRAVSAANFKLQLKGLENQILNAITYLKQQRKNLEDELPNNIARCDCITSNPRWKLCFGKT